MRTRLSAHALPLLVLATPFLAQAQVGVVSQIVGIFNIFVGVMLTVALMVYAIGFVMWIIRLGTWPSYRTEAIRVMEWSVAILFTLVVLLGIVQFFQRHPQEATYVLSAVIIIAIIWIVVYLSTHSEEKKDDHK